MQILRPSLTTYKSTWQVGFVERAVARKPIHWAHILRSTTLQNIGETFKGSVNYLSPFFINFYRGMGVLTSAELKKFPLERKIAGDEGELGDNEVSSEEYNIASTPPSIKADKLENDIKERPTKKRKLQRVTTLEIVDQRAGLWAQRHVPTRMRSTNEQNKQLQQKELECAKLWRILPAEENLHTKAEQKYVGLWIHMWNALKVMVELRDILKLSQKEFARKLKRAEELTATLAMRDQSHVAKLALKTKELQDCKAARSLKLEHREKLDADCSKLQSQLLAIEE
ncbi:hypothetical protein AXG93_2255s1300 [Marchantia polymorpha subsp. ruderalis]|uniref:Uncharacterized protein n=1 Tax=Marchantia polymorpha subsp. ruderalis TaxID=1480154 RepID=A0A176W759_MARPO|nr:hypothetical protein AXG93_2255s1300 [Marchantia polymorpha subsp. ruderalis]